LLALGTLLSYSFAAAAIAHDWDRISPWRPLAAVIDHIPTHDARVLVLGQFNGFADFYIARPIEFARFPALARAWQTGPVLAVVPSESLPRLPKPAPRVLAETDSGLTLIANFSVPHASGTSILRRQ